MSDQQYLDDVYYEMAQMVGSFIMYVKMEEDCTKNEVQQNSNCESFLLHARNLSDFFKSKDDKHKDDVRSHQFNSETTGKETLSNNTIVSINKRLVHLTKLRTPNKDWSDEDFSLLFERIVEFINEFVSDVLSINLDKDEKLKLKNKFKDLLERVKKAYTIYKQRQVKKAYTIFGTSNFANDDDAKNFSDIFRR